MSLMANQQLQTQQMLSHKVPDRNIRVRPKPFFGLQSEDVLSWLDHFENMSTYHKWDDQCKTLEYILLWKG